MSGRVVGVFLCSAIVGVGSLGAAPPEAKILFPTGAVQGATVEVTATGAFQPWPVKTWVSGTGVRYEPGKKAGQFTVVVDRDAIPGPRWVRFFNDEGASLPRPFLVGTHPESNEAESNDDLAKANEITAAPHVVNGVLGKSGDVDAFRIRLKRGERLSASLDANARLGSPVDGVLQLVDAGGHVLMQNHDDRGLDPALVLVAPRDGDFFLRVFGFPSTADSSVRFAGAPEFVYRLTVATGPSPAVEVSEEDARLVVPFDTPPAAEREPNDRKSPQPITAPAIVRGRIDQAGDRDVFLLKAKKGEAFHLRAVSRAIGYSVDPLLKIEGADGTGLARVDDVGRGEPDADTVWKAPADGEYRLVVEDLFGAQTPRHLYLLDVRPIAADFGLTLAASEFAAEAGKELEIPVTVVRPAGMTAEIEIGLETSEGKPFSAAAPVLSTAKGEAAKKVTLKLKPSERFSGIVRVVGTVKGPAPVKRAAVAPVAALPGGKIDLLWLTVKKK